MARPRNCRRVEYEPKVTYFKPAGIKKSSLPESVVTRDGLETIRLADLEGLYHDEAAKCMNVSRATFGRIVESAWGKVTAALVLGACPEN